VRQTAAFTPMGQNRALFAPIASDGIDKNRSILGEASAVKLAYFLQKIRRVNMIELDNVSKWYGAFQVLGDCSTTVARGDVVVVCGPSGSGKSTLIKTVNGLEPVQQGTIRVDGVTVTDPATDLPALRARIGMVFQNFELFPHLSIRANLALAQVKVLKRTPDEANARGLQLLERVGLLAQADKFPRQLSGGQQQRVAIARALAMDPVAMLFDEPTSALDPEMIGEVLDVMSSLAQDGMTMMVVTHEMGFARKVAGRIVFMDKGRIVEDTPQEQFFDAPASERAREFLARILH
jgi:glutamate/aspartate transport system ATP-binding protein